jgi:hypothetical protein
MEDSYISVTDIIAFFDVRIKRKLAYLSRLSRPVYSCRGEEAIIETALVN